MAFVEQDLLDSFLDKSAEKVKFILFYYNIHVYWLFTSMVFDFPTNLWEQISKIRCQSYCTTEEEWSKQVLLAAAWQHENYVTVTKKKAW